MYNLYFGSNYFAHNRNYQVVSFASIKYFGSLFQLDCEIKHFKLSFAYNFVTNNIFIGDKSALFFINGGLVTIKENNFSYNGMTSNSFERNYPDSLLATRTSQAYWPYEQYIFELS